MSDITESREQLKSFVERIETNMVEIEEIKASQRVIWAEAKEAGIDVKAMRRTIKRRMKDQKQQAAEEAVDALFRLALGMDAETPLHLHIEAIAKNDLGRGELVEVLKKICPPGGEFIISVGGSPMRIWRTSTDDKVFVEDYVPPLLEMFLDKKNKGKGKS